MINSSFVYHIALLQPGELMVTVKNQIPLSYQILECVMLSCSHQPIGFFFLQPLFHENISLMLQTKQWKILEGHNTPRIRLRF